MSAKTPTVSNARLYEPTNPEGIPLDTPAWLAWLEEATTRRFAYPLHDRRAGYITGFMTVRKERRHRGGWYWTVYRRTGSRLRKVYLGRAEVVTHGRLETLAQALLAEMQARTAEGRLDDG